MNPTSYGGETQAIPVSQRGWADRATNTKLTALAPAASERGAIVRDDLVQVIAGLRHDLPPAGWLPVGEIS